MRTNSVLSYILLGLEKAGRNVEEIEPVKENVNGNADNNANKTMKNPTEMNNDPIFGVKFDKTRVDQMILEDQLEYTIHDKGINVQTHQGNLTIEFKPEDSDRPRFHWYCVITVRYRRLVGRLSTVSAISSRNSSTILTKKKTGSNYIKLQCLNYSFNLIGDCCSLKTKK